MTDTTELAGALERLVLRQLLDPNPKEVVACPVPKDTTDADVDAARAITRQQLCEAGQVALAQQLDAATLQVDTGTCGRGLRRIIVLEWGDDMKRGGHA